MINCVIVFKSFLATILVLSFPSVMTAQNNSNEPKTLFEQGNYYESFIASKKLLESLPNDPVYNYYAGASLFLLASNYEESLEYLEKADSRLTPKELYLYKGKAFLYLFRLEEAKRALELYSQNFSLMNVISGEDTDWSKAVNNMQDASHNTSEIILLGRDTISENTVVDYYNTIENTTGSWTTKSSDYFKDLGIYPGEGFYYKSYEKSEDQCYVITGKKGLTRNDLDIYYTCLSDDIFQQTFEALPVFINSRKDQRYPIFIEKTQTLYFSSPGDKSIGGYDIFYSTYDKSKNRWSYPKNLGFPINSPFDDFLIGTTDNNGFYIATNRYQENNHIEIVLIKQGEATENISNADALLAKSKFIKEIKPKTINKELVSAIENLKKENEPTSLKEQSTKKLDKQSSPKPLSNEDVYKKQLDKALTLQLKADSVGRLADAKRYQLADIKDHNERIEEIKAIEKYEAEAEEIQKEADIAFAKVRKMELEEEAQHKSSNLKDEKSQQQQILKSNLKNEFKVFSSSPYSAQNPFDFDFTIPKGLLYRIQMGVFSKEITYDYFGGLSPVTGEIIEDRGLKKYYIGIFSNFSEADKALQQVHQQGFTDSFIVAWFNGNKVSINRAEEIEKELNR